MKIIGPDGHPLYINGVAQFPQDETGDQIMITRVRIRDFRSIEALDVQVPPTGLEVKGRNSIGKTNFARAIRTALTGVGVAPDAIREGATASEILVDTDDPKLAQIRQTITASGGTCTVKDHEGSKLARPRERLKEMFGLSSFDPLAFYRAKPSEQRAMLLESMPVTVTAEDVAKWTGEAVGAHGLDLTQNGLDVLAKLCKSYYDLRTSANKDVDMAEGEHRRALDKVESLEKPEHKGVVVPVRHGEEDEPVRAAEKAAEALEQRKQQAEAMAKRTEGTRARAAELRAQAEKVHENSRPPVPQDVFDAAEADWRAAGEEVTRLQNLLADAEVKRRRMAEKMSDLATQRESNAKSQAEVARLCQQASDLDASIAATAIEPPTASELSAAADAISAARAHAELVRSARAAGEAHMTALELAEDVRLAKDEAARLDRIVKTLQVEAPTELAARGNLIPGLTVTEDGVLYQGRPLDDSMSGAQRMLVAVQIARMLNPKAKLLVVDEIGVLDEDSMREFVRLCTADGWQLIATKMENVKDAEGKPVREMVLEAIEVA